VRCSVRVGVGGVVTGASLSFPAVGQAIGTYIRYEC
jgi:hypothetical protein